MEPFRLILANNGTVTGAHSIPSPSSSPVHHRPLIVGLHGGCYDHQYFNALPEYSASVASKAFGIPFIAIDRPSYGGTSCVLPIPEGSDFTQESAKLLHHSILPRLWTEFGTPNGCNCIVLLSHSLGVMVGIVVAAMHARDENPTYPLGGLIASGMGDVHSKAMKGITPSYPKVDETHALCPVEIKDTLMFKPGTYAPEMLQESERLNAICPIPELIGFATEWLPVWKEKWAPLVKAPVMFSLVEDDPFFEADEKEIDRCVRAFTNSVRVDGSLLRGAPHCVELSFWAQGWYARCFGFAMECSASFCIVGSEKLSRGGERLKFPSS
jgi:pimeloyl-ACP methyl ester carboxylesterase